MGRKWHFRDTGSLSGVDVEAAIRKQILIRLGVETSSELITATDPRRYAYVFAENVEQRAVNKMSAGNMKVVAQMRRAGSPQSALKEPAAEDTLLYPRDKVVQIRKGLRLKKGV